MTQITLPLDIPSLEILAQTTDKQGHIAIEVKSKKNSTKCKNCGKTATKRHGTSKIIKIRHLPILDTPVYLHIRPVRYKCEHCGTTTTEEYDWCNRHSRISKGLEGYILRCVVHSTVQDVAYKERLSYKTVAWAIERNMGAGIDWKHVSKLDTLGIDEISLRKGHKNYVTIISNRNKDGKLIVLGVLADRKLETVQEFLESIPKNLRKMVKAVCTDMYDGYVTAASNVFGKNAVVIDRYHVAKLYRSCLDKIRSKEMARLKDKLSEKEYKKLEGMMWILRHKHECLSDEDKRKLNIVYKHSPQLKKAHKLALKLTHIFNAHSNKKNGSAKLLRWIKSVKDSGLRCFDVFIGTLKKYKDMIANYFKARKNSGFVEGLNNLAKVIKRRCFGILNPVTFWQRLNLDLRAEFIKIAFSQ